MRVLISDRICDKYQAMADAQGRTLESVIESQLDRFSPYPPGQRTLALNVDTVQKALGGLPLRDGADLLKRIEDLAGITFHNIRLDFTAGQLEELQRRAEREEKSVDELARSIVEQLNRQFFWGTEAAASVR